MEFGTMGSGGREGQEQCAERQGWGRQWQQTQGLGEWRERSHTEEAHKQRQTGRQSPERSEAEEAGGRQKGRDAREDRETRQQCSPSISALWRQFRVSLFTE